MMATGSGPYLWWLVSRALGIVALGLISISVLLGLTMATRVLRRPGVGRILVRLHEHIALAGLAAIALHGLSLLGDPWLRPTPGSLAVPFMLSYRPLFTGLGVLAGYLAAVLGLSFYARRRIGVRLWRRLHRATVIVWLLGVAHTLGAGSDASTPWLRGPMLLTGLPIVYLATLRILGGGRPPAGAKLAPRAKPRTGPALPPGAELPPTAKPASRLKPARRRVPAQAPAASAQRSPLAGSAAPRMLRSTPSLLASQEGA
jgi:sulfoxide reductase heme-binding subunit YedZ